MSSPTCFNSGLKKRTCLICETEESVFVEKLNHNFSHDETANLDVCDLCNAYTYNGHIYMIYEISLVWSEAKTYCENLNGHLLTITSESEQDFINRLLSKCQNSYYWTGASFNNNWGWITGESFDYTNWADGEPNNVEQQENYIHIYANPPESSDFGKWNDTKPYGSGHNDNYNIMYFSIICEWDQK